MLTYYFDAISVVDLFSGTGNISYEFASRGTKKICSVDAHAGCIRYINTTAKELDLNFDCFLHTLQKFYLKILLELICLAHYSTTPLKQCHSQLILL